MNSEARSRGGGGEAVAVWTGVVTPAGVEAVVTDGVGVLAATCVTGCDGGAGVATGGGAGTGAFWVVVVEPTFARSKLPAVPIVGRGAADDVCDG